jgi:DNA-3-methyladenine glycosylase II
MARRIALRTLQADATRHWLRTDAVLGRLSQDTPLPRPPLEPADAFSALVESITHQQVSLAAGRSIHARLVAAVGGATTPEGVAHAGFDRLRGAGLSRSKATYVLDLAQKTMSGAVELQKFGRMEDEDIIAELTAVKGIGVWTAKMFLIFHLRRPDVSCPEDLGLRLAVKRFYRVSEARAADVMRRKAPAWAPYNSVANLVLWAARRDAGQPPSP